MKPLICNLKMNHDFKDMLRYKNILESICEKNLILCPSFCFLPIMHSKNYTLASQDVSAFSDSNHTGEVSAKALKSINVKATLIGHSDISTPFELKVSKLKQALNENMHVYIIISDTKEDYDYQYTSLKLLSQIRGYLSQVIKSKYSKITFVYEPTWLVGKDETLLLKDVENIFYFMKTELQRDYGIVFPFFYGGGLSDKSIDSFYQSEYIDGILLGKYSFDANNIIDFIKKVS